MCPRPSRCGEGHMLQKGQAMEHLAMCGKAGEGPEQMSRMGWEAGRGVKGGNQ